MVCHVDLVEYLGDLALLVDQKGLAVRAHVLFAVHRFLAPDAVIIDDLLADTDKSIVEKYGVWGEKSMYGKKYMGTMRKTFLIDEQGKIAKIFDKVDVAKHADEVLEAFGEK